MVQPGTIRPRCVHRQRDHERPEDRRNGEELLQHRLQCALPRAPVTEEQRGIRASVGDGQVEPVGWVGLVFELYFIVHPQRLNLAADRTGSSVTSAESAFLM